MRDLVYQKILKYFKLSDKEKRMVESAFEKGINFPRLMSVIDTMITYHIQDEVLVAYIVFQCFKVDEDAGEQLSKLLSQKQQKLYETFKILRSVRTLTAKGEAEDMRRMFVAICQDVRVVIIKFATILYDLKQIKNPMSDNDREFVKMVQDIFAPLAERLGLINFKYDFEDTCFELLEPNAYEYLKNNALLKYDDNQKQIKITEQKLKKIFEELKIKGQIQARQKHFYSVYKKLVKKNITLGKVYDLIAMRVIVPTVEDCYLVLGKIHQIYKPMAGRMKDYIAYPKPNGYQSLHTTVVVDNNRPLEIQIRTTQMHKQSEYGVAAHWIYKEDSRAQNKFDQRLTWFRQMLESAQNLSSEEFLETLKTDLYGESIFVQTPKGKILELPLGASLIDFAYAIHTDIGNTCVGGKVNGKIVPITSTLSNGDVVEILTNQNSKGPSRDWLAYVKTGSARSKIRNFFKNELKDDNIRVGKSILEQAIKTRNLNLSKILKEEYLQEIMSHFVIEDLETLYAEIGAGSMPVNNVIGRLVNLYNKEKVKEVKQQFITIKKSEEGVLVDGDTGLLVRYAHCCSPVMGDEIVGYISRGKGVTIHRKGCHNLKYLEAERLIDAQWQQDVKENFVVHIKILTDDDGNVVNELNNFCRNLQGKLLEFGYKLSKDALNFDVSVQISKKSEADDILTAIDRIKGVRKVFRGE